MSSKLWTRDFLNITIINLLIFVAFQIILVILPVQVKTLGGTDVVIGWISGVTTIASLLTRPIAGFMLDKYNKKVILIIGIGVIITTTFLFGFISAIGMILFVRFLYGIGWGFASTASNTLATNVIPEKKFGEGMGYFGLSSGLAMAFAPTFALSILGMTGFRNTTIFSVVIATVALVLAKIFSTEKNKTTSATKSIKALYERASMIPSVIMFFVTASYGAIIGFIAIYGAQRGIENIGLFFTIYAIAVMIFRPVAGKIIDKYGYTYIMMPGLILLTVALFILSKSMQLQGFLCSAFLYGVAFGAVQSCLQTIAIVKAPPGRKGAANATFFTGFDAGIGFGSVIGGMIASSFGYSRMYQFFGSVMIVAFLIYAVFNFKEKKIKSTNE